MIAPATGRDMGGTGISALDHLGLVVDDAQQCAALFAKLSGIGAPAIRDNHAEGMRERHVRYRGELIGGGTLAAWFTLGGASVNLMEPNGAPSPWSDYLEANGPGGCYLAFAVPDVPATLEALAALGYPTVQTGNTAGGATYGYGDARTELGVYLEILPDRAGPGGAGTLQPSEGAPQLAAVGFSVPDAVRAAAAWARVLDLTPPATVRGQSSITLDGGTRLEFREEDEPAPAIRSCTLALSATAPSGLAGFDSPELGVFVGFEEERGTT